MVGYLNDLEYDAVVILAEGRLENKLQLAEAHRDDSTYLNNASPYHLIRIGQRYSTLVVV